jgi:hypothetical protein
VSDADKIQQWYHKLLHGRYLNELNQEYMDTNGSHACLTQSDIFPETEGLMCAIMDQVTATNNYRKYILKDNTADTDLCRHCQKESETKQHITGACSQLVSTAHKLRHDQIYKIIHQKLAYKYGLLNKTMPYYKYIPRTILESEIIKLCWDRSLITDKAIHNRPDPTLVDKVSKTLYFIDIAIPNNHNRHAKYAEKLAKYSELSVEIKDQWKMDTVATIPITQSTNRIIPETLHKALNTFSLHANTFIGLQKATILNTCSIVRQFLNIHKTTHLYNTTDTSLILGNNTYSEISGKLTVN